MAGNSAEDTRRLLDDAVHHNRWAAFSAAWVCCRVFQRGRAACSCLLQTATWRVWPTVQAAVSQHVAVQCIMGLVFVLWLRVVVVG